MYLVQILSIGFMHVYAMLQIKMAWDIKLDPLALEQNGTVCDQLQAICGSFGCETTHPEVLVDQVCPRPDC